MSEGTSSAPPTAGWAPAERLTRLPLARATQVALGATIVLFVFGSSSVAELQRAGSPLRWVGLMAFAGLAILWAAGERGDVSRLVPVAAPVGALAALGIVSAAWSVEPRLTIERGATFVVALVGTGAVAAAVRGRSAQAALVAEAVVGATTLVCVAGGIFYAVDPAKAAQLPMANTPLRFGGIGENPNTVQMIAAIGVFPAAWLALRSGGRRRLSAAVAFVVLCGHVAASGSRGGLLAIAAGGVCFSLAAPGTLRRRLALLAGAVVVAVAVLGGNQAMLATIPPGSASSLSPNGSTPGSVTSGSSGPVVPGTGSQKPEKYPVAVLPSLDSERGSTSEGNRSLVGRDGRVGATLEALHQGNARPVAGFGFGTEEHVFFDRLEVFNSSRPENSFLGLYLQLGVLGPLLWLVVGLVVASLGFVRARRLDPDVRFAAAAFLAAVVAGYALGLGQSYVYSVGNVATLGFWVSALLVAGLVASPRAWPSSRRLLLVVVAGVAGLGLFAGFGRWEGARDRDRQNAGIAGIWAETGGLDGRELDGFRRSPPYECLFYAVGQEPAAYELCFQGGRLVEAIDRLGGRFRYWSLRPFGPTAAAISVSAAAVDARLRSLGAYRPTIDVGPGYLARPIP